MRVRTLGPVEIGRTPHRDRSGSGSRSVVVQCGVVFGVGGCVSRAGQPWAGSERRLRMPGAVGVAHSRTLRVSRNRGIMRNNTVSSGHGPAPMCTDHPHRTWEPDRHTPRSPEKPVIPTKTSPHPTKAAVSHVQHRQQPRPPGATSTPPNQPTTNSSWNSTDLNADYDRSRGEDVPISTRKWTDLGTGYDRSRGGARPAQWRREGDSNPRCARRTAVFKTATFGRSVISPCPHNHSNHSMLMRATRHYHHRPGAQRHGPRGQSASAASTASAESTASAAPTGVNRGRRTPACESVWPTPAPARRACPDVPPPRPAPSPATRADGA